MVVANEGNIYLDKIEERSENWSNSVFLVIPLRLGLNSILPEYLDSIRKVFTLSQNVGIAGGRENSALYFVGITDSNNLIYLDPHFVQKSASSVDIAFNERLQRHINTYHCSKMKMLALDKMCTSVAIGFYIRDEEDYEDFKQNITTLSRGESSIFSVYEKKPRPLEMEYNFRNETIKI
jgi:cysteine protease ATG4